MTRVAPPHVYAWIEKIRDNLRDFQAKTSWMSPTQRVAYIRRQYQLLNMLVRAIDGKIQFVGAYHRKPR